jgi:hypothetical protein
MGDVYNQPNNSIIEDNGDAFRWTTPDTNTMIEIEINW